MLKQKLINFVVESYSEWNESDNLEIKKQLINQLCMLGWPKFYMSEYLIAFTKILETYMKQHIIENFDLELFPSILKWVNEELFHYIDTNITSKADYLASQ